MSVQARKALTIAVSSRALFDLEASNRVFDEQGPEAFIRHQIDREKEVLAPGVAFPLVSKLLALNRITPPSDTAPSPREAWENGAGAGGEITAGQGMPTVEVILLSRNNADSGLRVFNAIAYHKLAISRAAFTTGRSPYPYAQAFHADLFLSANDEDVRSALNAGVAAATVLPTPREVHAAKRRVGREEEIRIAFDGDAVLFSDQAERVYKQSGLEAFHTHEQERVAEPLPPGPFAGFLNALHRVQSAFPSETSPIRTALITARGVSAHERVIRTLRQWEIRLDEIVFLDGQDKRDFLEAFGADIFFDDQQRYVQSAARTVGSAHVPHGVANEG